MGNRGTSKRAFLIILDSVGIGEMPDARDFGDVGADTLGNIALHAGLKLPTLSALGLANIQRGSLAPLAGLTPSPAPDAAFGRLAEQSQGKDTATGHWELCGVVTEEGFRTFPEGFPDTLLNAFIETAGVGGVLGNKAVSGTVIIEQLGAEHVRTGWPIVYTSADPVFQIAAHEEVVPLETLYRWCKIAYDIMIPAGQNRVIARPFVGTAPNFTRTYNRKDFACPPPRPTLLERLSNAGVEVTGVGKIPNIFADRGITHAVPTHGNDHGVGATLELLKSDREGLIFTNLVDFDARFGHRRNPAGYAECLERFDAQLPELLDALRPDDLLIITADHGNDPTFRGTDHTREYVPVLIAGEQVKGGTDLGTRDSFADIGQTIAEYFGIAPLDAGSSFLNAITDDTLRS